MKPPRLVLPLLLVLIASSVAPAQAADKLRVGKGVPFAWTFIPVDVGKSIGVWDALGIDVEIIGFQGAAKQQRPLRASADAVPQLGDG